MADGGFTFGSGFVGAQDPQGQTPAGQNSQGQFVQPAVAQPVYQQQIQQVQPLPQPVQQAPVYGMPQGTYDPNTGYAAPAPQMPAQPVYQQPMQPQPMQQTMGYNPNAGQMAQAQGVGAPLAGMGDASGGAAQPPFDPNYKFGEKMKNFTTTVKLPEHTIKVDDAYFLNLLAGSISLTRDEKKKIVDSFGKLRQEQVDELIRIFEEERTKFVELSSKHGAQLKKLEDEHAADWKDIEVSYTVAQKKEEEDAKADAIRKQLGLN